MQPRNVLMCLIYLLSASDISNAIFDFPGEKIEISPVHIAEDASRQATQLGVESEQRQERLEDTIISYNIKVANGSISHAQLLESLPNEEAEKHDCVARKILKASQFLSAQCRILNIGSCASCLSAIQLPRSELREQCLGVIQNCADCSHTFRRLLPANYRDGFYEMWKYPNVPRPGDASNLAEINQMSKNTEERDKNLIFVQWAQFIEHDLSKPAATTMKDGVPIECCNSDFGKLKPRYVHPACAPLEGPTHNIYETSTCLNYVRSALSLQPGCNYGPAQQFNQATSILDLSQLYGHTNESQNKMRAFTNGLLKTSGGNLLPFAQQKGYFCAYNENTNKPCFMAGDSRVNSNPFMNLIYTVFLRSHNRIAVELKNQRSTWSDEQLFQVAKQRNINIYRNIIYNEWLPGLLGEKISKSITEESTSQQNHMEGVSNEFAVAAIRFYYSMMPNALLSLPLIYQNTILENVIDANPRSIHPEQLFSLRDQFYKSEYLTNPNNLEIGLDAMLRQRALKMDSQYADSVIKHFLQTEMHSNRNVEFDALAWDIQRGRDHGLSGYVKYLEVCEKTKINDWSDLRGFIRDSDIENIKSVYKSVEKIDLIIGGISEIPKNGSMLGPTFTCILGEQFFKLRRRERFNLNENNLMVEDGAYLHESETISGRELLCKATLLEDVPRSIFLPTSETNRPIPCTSS